MGIDIGIKVDTRRWLVGVYRIGWDFGGIIAWHGVAWGDISRWRAFFFSSGDLL
jgi:hypothetical protein